MANRVLQTSLILSLVANLFLFGAAAYMVKHRIGQLCNKTAELEKTSRQPSVGSARIKFRQHVSVFRTLPDDDGEIVFLGDSHVAFGRWPELCADPSVSNLIKNRGIGGDNTQQMLQRIDEVTAAMPSQVFITIGSNDMGQGRPVAEIVENYRTIVTALQDSNPDVRVFMHSVFPVNMRLNGWSIDYQGIIDLNQRLESLSEELGASYIDVYSKLLDEEQQLDAAYTFDGLHLNGAGYGLWHEELRKHLPASCSAQ